MNEKILNSIIFILLLISTMAICNEPFYRIGSIPINYYRIFLIFMYLYILFYCLIKKKSIVFLLLYTIFIFGFSLLKFAINSSLVINFLNCYTGGALIFFIFYSFKGNAYTLKLYMRIFIIFSTFNLLIGIIEYYTRTNFLGSYLLRRDGFSLSPLFSGIRVDGVFKTPELFIIECDLAIMCIFEMRKFKKRKVQVLLIILFLYSNLICYFTMNLVFLLMMYSFKNIKRLSWRNFAILLLIALGFLFYKNNDYFLNKSIGSYYTRLGGYIYNINKIKDSPLLGQNKSDIYYDIVVLEDGIVGNTGCHNIILEILVDGGIVLLTFVLLFYLYVIRKLRNIDSLFKNFFILYIITWGAIFSIIVLYNINIILYAFLGCIVQLGNSRSSNLYIK